jgi:hypothetical protein
VLVLVFRGRLHLVAQVGLLLLLRCLLQLQAVVAGLAVHWVQQV